MNGKESVALHFQEGETPPLLEYHKPEQSWEMVFPHLLLQAGATPGDGTEGSSPPHCWVPFIPLWEAGAGTGPRRMSRFSTGSHVWRPLGLEEGQERRGRGLCRGWGGMPRAFREVLSCPAGLQRILQRRQGPSPNVINSPLCSLGGLHARYVISFVSDSMWLYGLSPTRLFCQWDPSSKNTGVECHALLQGIFSNQGLNLCLLCLLHFLLHFQSGSLPLVSPRKPRGPTANAK